MPEVREVAGGQPKGERSPCQALEQKGREVGDNMRRIWWLFGDWRRALVAEEGSDAASVQDEGGKG